MALVLNTNPSATIARQNLAKSQSNLEKSINRLSSGQKITSPADDAGGLAVSMKLVAAGRRTEAVNTNLQNSISYLQSQDGALVAVGDLLNRMSELAILANDPTKNDQDIANYDKEFSQIQQQLGNLANESFNGVDFFDGATFDVITTEDGDTGQAVTITNPTLLATGNELDIVANTRKLHTSIAGADPVISVGDITSAIQRVATWRADNGATTSRLQYASNMLDINNVNLEAANSRIMDTDIAAESTRMAKFNILTQSGAAMLAQANQVQQIALRLLQ